MNRWQYRVELSSAGRIVEIRYFNSRAAAGLFAYIGRVTGWEVAIYGERWV